MTFQRGDNVAVRFVGDCGNKKHEGKEGTVEKLCVGSAKVGDSPTDPFIIVQFPDGTQDGFWTEELRKI